MNRDTAHAGEGTVQFFVFVGAMVPVLLVAGALWLATPVAAVIALVLGAITAAYLAGRFKVIAQWENAPLIKFGKVRGFAKPGINWIPPFYKIYDRIDMRTRTEVFDSGEVQNFSLDQVPLRVNAVVFWRVENATLAVTKVANFQEALKQRVQTTLRDIIGRTTYHEFNENRQAVGDSLKMLIDERTVLWGVDVESVEVKDIFVQDQEIRMALVRQAAARVDAQAKVTMAEGERNAAEVFNEAAAHYTPTALQLRALGVMHEAVQDNSTIVLMPNAALDAGAALSAVAATTSQAAAVNGPRNP
jgi:regulator of protease activity HflC (stomatin/prohibitin superfamily)